MLYYGNQFYTMIYSTYSNQTLEISRIYLMSDCHIILLLKCNKNASFFKQIATGDVKWIRGM